MGQAQRGGIHDPGNEGPGFRAEHPGRQEGEVVEGVNAGTRQPASNPSPAFEWLCDLRPFP